ncbi:MAG: hypothetical protein GWM98_29115 [Nitrospinaceae bacterium]|nr:hypothetical protein [Nitrospinaceae bacterium]NIR57769.1 hypothetical protein [Nitrospinaceae bacterium]NIS88231.1 hypothetical protein [Nitrospinaceae bacterium]NIT85111.1 hypothetical protein [Nitrospinaceae bacterium]NIU47268.1 hypothetical protein [Nitrospinaceae bacterium]
MNLKKIIATAMTVSCLTVLVAQTAMAQPEGNLNWTFTPGVQAKITQSMDQRESRNIGLNTAEQKMLHKYGIENGDMFYTRLNDVIYKAERTSSGVKIMERAQAHSGEYREAPVQKSGQLVSTVFGPSKPAPVWVCDRNTAKKITRHMNRRENPVRVGLSAGEQKALDKYGYHIGQTFQIDIDGRTYDAERTSLGLKVHAPVADRNAAEHMDGSNEVRG